MFKGTVRGVTSVAGADIPFNVAFNTNSKIGYSNNKVNIYKPGIYEANCQLEVAGIAAGSFGIQFYVNGVAVPEATSGFTSTGATDTFSVSLTDLFRVVPAATLVNANISVRITAAANIISGVLTVKEIR